jgi:hypothetical protein
MKRPIVVSIAVAAVAFPATASAASIKVASPNGSPAVVYQAAAGEINALRMRAFLPGPKEFFEFSAPLAAGPGCVAGLPARCDGGDVYVSLGDKDDVADTNTFISSLTMDAGGGDDDVLAGGIEATANGGGGNDTIHLAANDAATGNGGSGRDRVAGGLGASSVTLTGGGGNDLLVPGGFILNNAAGGAGNDRLVSFTGREVTLTGDGGNDVLVASTGTGRIALDGGADHDIAFSHLGDVTANAGSGYDVVDVRGGETTAPDTVTCGTGFDVVFADTGDSVAEDCELRLDQAAPTLPPVTDAEADAQELLAHRPDPSSL